MITVTLHPNGFVVRGHARIDICHQVSMWTWMCANAVFKRDSTCAYYTSDHDNRADVGYTHATFDESNDQATEMYQIFRENLQVWSGHFGWGNDGHLEIVETDERLVIPPGFRERLGIMQVIGASE